MSKLISRSLLPMLLAACAPAPEESVGRVEQALSPQCAAPEHRQFDFWRGRWQVHNPMGALVGFNTIRRIQDGCALQESWEGGGGTTGTSLNFYSPFTRTWHQTWVDSSGGALSLEGGIVGDRMVMTGTRPRLGGPGSVLHRLSWEPLPGGKVRQLWDLSTDRGATWTVAFDGLYSR
jgi:hypothetical protein